MEIIDFPDHSSLFGTSGKIDSSFSVDIIDHISTMSIAKFSVLDANICRSKLFRVLGRSRALSWLGHDGSRKRLLFMSVNQ